MREIVARGVQRPDGIGGGDVDRLCGVEEPWYEHSHEPSIKLILGVDFPHGAPIGTIRCDARHAGCVRYEGRDFS